ncbi:hypothetical protein ALI22I_24960 [Saccharothrix sp. ALI-22-I]|nr:hypothetical protein ALI22I_24960 [Saccharothrix sp. ALI-22-I]
MGLPEPDWTGYPPVDDTVVALIGRMAREDPGWATAESKENCSNYAAVVLRAFREESAEVVEHLSTVVRQAKNPVRHLADARMQLSVDAALATAAVDAYRSELVRASGLSGRGLLAAQRLARLATELARVAQPVEVGFLALALHDGERRRRTQGGAQRHEQAAEHHTSTGIGRQPLRVMHVTFCRAGVLGSFRKG